MPDLRLEKQFYKGLRSVQGSIVSICMGNIDCVYPYYYDFATEIVHFLLLSWAGEALGSNSQSSWESHADHIFTMNGQLRSLGVAHGDIRPENVLWNETLSQLMFIDFERSTLIPRTKAKITKLPSSSPPLTAKSKVSASSVCADKRRFELCSSPTKKRKRSSSVDGRYDQQIALRFRHGDRPERQATNGVEFGQVEGKFRQYLRVRIVVRNERTIVLGRYLDLSFSYLS